LSRTRKKKQNKFLSNPIWTAIGLIASSFCLGLMNLYFGTGQYKLDLYDFYLEQPNLIILNSVPFVLLALLLWFITNRPWLAFAIDGAICLFYSWASYWKLMARSDPIYAEDLAVFKAAAEMSTNYIHITWQILFSAGLVLFATLFIALLFRGRFKRASFRLVSLALVMAGCFCLYTNVYTNDTIYNQFKVWSELNQWFENSQFISRGSIYPFIHSIPKALKKPPEGYDSDEAKAILDSYQDSDISEDKQVSVICYMLEAFSDLTQYTDKLDGADAYKLYHKLCKESYTGKLITNIFAGGTIDTERSAVTGFYSLPSLRSSSWSYARYFKEQGYNVMGAHAGYEEFYNRLNINRNLGFDNYLFIENYFSTVVEGIPNDKVFFSEMTKLSLESIESGTPVFAYNVSYQNHGPYSDTGHYFSKDYISLKNAGSEAAYNIVNNYLSGIEDTCLQLSKMVEEYSKSDEPIVLVIFGDHKPWLGEQSWVYPEIGIDLEDYYGDWFYSMYGTEYLIWANDAAKAVTGNKFKGMGPDISPCFLMNEVLQLCGYDGPAYAKFTNEVKAQTPVITTLGWYRENNQLIKYEELSDKAKELINKMSYVQYYLSHE